jgi:hypothetical protein
MARVSKIRLPPAVQAELDRQGSGKQTGEDQLEKIGLLISQKRDEAVSARKDSGIEATWMESEEQYLSIDDMNRSEFATAKWAKPSSKEGPVTTGRPATGSEVRSTVFVPLTARYVDAGAARLSEILLPIDGKPFSLDATPVPQLIAGKDDLRQVTDEAGNSLERDPTPDELAQMQEQQPGAQPAAPGAAPTPVPGQPTPGVPLTVKDLAEENMEAAQAAAKKAETRIYDWMVESQYPAEMRKVVFDGARIGTGMLKAPFPEKRKSQSLSAKPGAISLVIKEEVKPAYRWIDVWNFFPHGACGEDIHNGDHTFERDYLAPKQVRNLKGQPGYITSQIDKVLEEGPNKSNADGSNPHQKKIESRYPVWYFYGSLSRDDMKVLMVAGLHKPESVNDLNASIDDVNVIVTMINDTVVRATFNPLDSGKFPYHAFRWSRRAGHWAGVGIGEKIRTPQRMVNAATRTLLNNAGKSAGAQTVLNRGAVTPADQSWTITPDKIWFLNSDDMADPDVRKVFAVFQIPNVGDQMMKIIEYAMKMGEECTSIPLVTQGQSGPTQPETLGGLQLQNSNADQLLRSIGYSIDDDITDPVVRDSYEWLLLDPSVPDEEKGDFNINAHGSSALVERAIQDKTIEQMSNLVANPAFGIDPKRWFKTFMKTKRLDPRDVCYTEAEQAKIDAQPPAPPPTVQAAQVRVQGALQVQQQKDQAALQQVSQEAAHEQQLLQAGGTTPHMASATARIEQEKIRATSAENVEASRSHAEAARADKELQIATQNGQFEIQKMQLQRDLAILEYSQQHNLTLEQVKVDMAKTAMQEQTKRQLASAELQLATNEGNQNRAVDVHKHHNPVPVPVSDTAKVEP